MRPAMFDTVERPPGWRWTIVGIGVCAMLSLSQPAASQDAKANGPRAEAARGMVVSVSRPASEVGVDVLKRGGNAVDAAVAVAFALQVTWPEAGNIGGGGFMLVHPGTGKEPTLVDYRETAPAAATAEMFRMGNVPQSKLVGIPGTVRGLAVAHGRFGMLPWKDLVAPAVTLAEDGIVVNEALAKSLNETLAKPGGNDEFRLVYGKADKSPWQAGDRLVQKDLAATLRTIAEQGADAFYSGRLADLFDTEMKLSGGIATKNDLNEYRAKERTPIVGRFRGYHVYAPPPPSSGGICLVEMLNVVGPFDLKKEDRWSPRTVHVMTEAMRLAFCDRARHLGDPDFVKIPNHLTTPDYAKTLAGQIDLAKATKSDELGKDIVSSEGSQTTHFSIIDAKGMAVSNTYTLEDAFGARIVVKGAGYLLNNEMGDFNPKPGITDRNGLIGTPANRIAPGKRMLSSMCPTIVTRDGRVVLITGSPGGRTIINTVFGVLVNSLEYEMPLRDAVDSPRCHHSWMPDRLVVEPEFAAKHRDLVQRLGEMGHVVETRKGNQGDAHSIQVDVKTGRIHGVADRRLDGWAAGY